MQTIKQWFQLRIVQCVSFFIVDHSPVQRTYADQITDAFYIKFAPFLPYISNDEYEEVNEFLTNLVGVIIASPTIYDSTKNAHQFCMLKMPRIYEILSRYEKDYDDKHDVQNRSNPKKG